MTVHLVVVRPFGKYTKGETITDAATVTQILAGEFKHHVVRIAGKGS
jgi:hypothetical protein